MPYCLAKSYELAITSSVKPRSVRLAVFVSSSDQYLATSLSAGISEGYLSPLVRAVSIAVLYSSVVPLTPSVTNST